MRTFMLLGFLACAVFAVCEAKRCKSQDDCEADECCSRLLLFSYCMKRKTEGELCVEDIEDMKVKDSDVYKFTCPCAGGLTCKNIKDDTKEDSGISNFFNTKCVKE